MYKYCSIITAVIGFCLLALGTIGSWHIFPSILYNQIHKNVDLVEGTQAYEFWKKQPFPLKFKIYFFNVVNPDEVQMGGNPIVKEAGPYVYDEYRERVDISVDEDHDILKYKLKKWFIFNQNESGCRSDEDTVTIINAALVGTALKVNDLLPSALPMISQAIPYLYPGIKDVFMRTKVKDILFDGIRLYCQDPAVDFVCTAIKGSLPKTMRIAENDKDVLFSMFGYLNGSTSGPWEMGRGLKNTTRGEIYSFEGQSDMDVWGNEYCNQINGSDSTVFEIINGPERKPRLYAFAEDFCRSLYATYENDTTFFGLPAIRYTSTADSLANSEENKCFCPSKDDEDGNPIYLCPPSGVTDITSCVKAPVLVSYPHFYLGDPKLREYVSGLNPQKHLHENFAFVEPRTATPLAGRKRVQMNIELKQLPEFEFMANVSNGIFPILWIEEGVTLPDDIAEMLVSNLSKTVYLDYAKWALIGSGIITLLIAFILLLNQENLLCFAKNNNFNVSVPKSIRRGEDNLAYETNPSLYPQLENKQINMPQRNRVNHQWNATSWVAN